MARFFAPDGAELLPRKDRVWSSGAVAGRVLAALEANDRKVPAYLKLAAEELREVDVERAVFAMRCFWQGEAALGGKEGVRATRAGWLAGLEVVEVLSDPERIAYANLVRAAQSFDCAERGGRLHRAQADSLSLGSFDEVFKILRSHLEHVLGVGPRSDVDRVVVHGCVHCLHDRAKRGGRVARWPSCSRLRRRRTNESLVKGL